MEKKSEEQKEGTEFVGSHCRQAEAGVNCRYGRSEWVNAAPEVAFLKEISEVDV